MCTRSRCLDLSIWGHCAIEPSKLSISHLPIQELIADQLHPRKLHNLDSMIITSCTVVGSVERYIRYKV
jgi:hypothetical protein